MVNEAQPEDRVCEKIKTENKCACLDKDTSVTEPSVNLRLEYCGFVRKN